jgi:hypothetical protein
VICLQRETKTHQGERVMHAFHHPPLWLLNTV